ncbi:alpha/beta hydrolase family protein [Porphyrobacter sp. CACIAM 03H1]|uniref:alpha/beta hydrolase family protein n=1 Tax=Porphyrobacter sp. CACIAM 03H1 TaxID=2003315 RepID=UPI000B5AB55F|nr:prolyl oligopeptidase family serine peptidase [Porphyrobacter sp. CACIAM 03H1]ASJ90549.1 peptidase S9 [Porphyrobacter sp. CACIAM 03H1]
MKLLKASLAAALVGASALGLLTAAPAPTQAQGNVPIEVWALRDVVNAVQISPDGKHLLVHKVESREGDYILEIYRTDDLSKPLRRLAADPMEIISATWVSGTKIYGSAWQVIRKTVKGQEEDVRGYQSFFYDLEANKFSRVDGNFGLVNTLPKEPDHILVSTGTAVGDGTGSDPFARFRPRSYYKFDLNTGARTLVLRGSGKFPQATFDNDGNPRFTQSIDSVSNKLQFFYRKPGDGSWTQFLEYDLNDVKNVATVYTDIPGLVGLDPDNPNLGYFVNWAEGEDKAALFEFDFQTGKLGKKLFQDKDADVMGIQTHSIPGNDRMVAAIYPGAKMERHWFDEEEKALYQALEQQIPYAHQVSISSRSVDGRSMIVTNRGPRDPGSFWLVKDGKLAKLGSRNPLLNPETLADVEYIRYPARDGRIIPGYVTKPKGKGPFPLIVLPHGGPMVNEVITYDEWGQLLANQGYMVLQPQYRVTVGWGREHFLAGFGEYGKAMQDDKDDGALYLVKQGLVDPDRIAMFGWSYGGYAALIAASREPNIYQCTIAGAAVSNWPKLKAVWGRGRDSAVDQYWLNTAFGVNPVDEVAKVNIPLLMVHGDVDRRVLYYHFTDYKKAFEQTGKDGQFITLEGADHFYNTLMYTHQQQFFTKMLDYLANDCGPGGL